jgi:hypothetical protein
VAQLHCSSAGYVLFIFGFQYLKYPFLWFLVSIRRHESGTLKDGQNSPTVRANGLAPAKDGRTFETAMKSQVERA